MDHASRRDALARALADPGVDGLIVTRLPNARYLSGFSGSAGILVAGGDAAVLLTDGRYALQAAREAPGVEVQILTGDLTAGVPDAVRRVGAARVGFEADSMSFRRHAGLAERGLDLVPTEGIVERLRWIKDDEEAASIQAAQDAADHAFQAIAAKLAEGMTEREVAFELEAAMRQSGSERVAFDTIVAFGPNAAEPHHHPTDRPLGRGEIVKMDFGAVVRGYHSDMTRTVAFGEASARAREVYEAVRAAQAAGVAALAPGVTAGTVDAVARESVAAAGFGAAFTHPLGHGVGLEIHEGPSLRRDGADVVPAGAVVTVEPGVYLEGEFGIRIEDMVLVTGGGPRVMAASPKELLVL